MPHPGLDVAISPEFHGEIESEFFQSVMEYFKYYSFIFIEISDDFKAQLHALVPHIFDPNNIVVKAINGQLVTCRELVVYIKVIKI
jgi:hypothetical protein